MGFLDALATLIFATIVVLLILIAVALVLRGLERLLEIRLRFTLQDLLLLFVLVWSALAVFGLWGLAVAGALLLVVAYVRTGSWHEIGWLEIGCVILAILVVPALLSSAVRTPRGPHYRTYCMNNLHQLAVALLSYHQDHHRFPPAYTLGPDGTPWHSWRVLILPYLGEKALYDQYDFDEPWNGPNNSRLAAQLSEIYVYSCPSDAKAQSNQCTDYFAVLGPNAAWPGDRAASKANFIDGLGRTILIVESTGRGVHWMEPKDLSFEEAAAGIGPVGGPGLSSAHVVPGGLFHHDVPGMNVAFAGGSVHTLSQSTPPETLRALLTRAGGDMAPGVPLIVHPLNWTRIVGLSTLGVSVLLLTFRPQLGALFRRRRKGEEAQAGPDPEDL
jgi:hypothetical protein